MQQQPETAHKADCAFLGDLEPINECVQANSDLSRESGALAARGSVVADHTLAGCCGAKARSAEPDDAHARERRDELVLPGPSLLDANRDAPG